MIRVLAVAHSSRRRVAELVTLATLTLAFAPAAYASGSSMPWETPLNSILESVQGPVALSRLQTTMPLPSPVSPWQGAQ